MTAPARRPRNSKGHFARTPETAERDGRACLLIAQGHTYATVAAELGYGDKASCWRAVQAVLVETARSSGTEALRTQQLVEIAELKRRMWAIIDDPGPLVDRLGRPVHDENGEAVPDAQAQTAAAAVILRCAERTSKLRGLDSPKRTITMDRGDIESLIKLGLGEVDKLAGERTADERRAAIIAVTPEPPE